MDSYDFPQVTQLAIPFFVAAILIELWLVRSGRAKGSFETRDTLTSLMMGTGNVVAGLLLGVVSYWALLWLWQFRVFNLGLSVWVFLTAFLLDDLRYYVYHRIAHRVRWVWAEHVNHHSSQHYNLSTALRQSWTGLFTFMFVLQAPLVLLGFHPAVIAFTFGFNLVYQFWIHTEAVKRMPGWFEAVMNTPSHHRVHHAINPRYLDSQLCRHADHLGPHVRHLRRGTGGGPAALRHRQESRHLQPAESGIPRVDRHVQGCLRAGHFTQRSHQLSDQAARLEP